MNSVNLIGRLTKDVELKKTPNGTSTCSFTVAINRMKTKENQNPETDFINCVAWRGSADYLTNYSKKGDLVSVQGKIQTRNYDDQYGKKVYVTEVLASHVSILNSKTSNNSNNYEENYNEKTPNFDQFISSDELPF